MRRAIVIALLIAAQSAALAAEPIGRLFLTPDERVALDNARRQKLVVTPPPPAPAPVVELPRGPELFTINGVVKRSDGQSTVWVNGKPVTGAQAPNGATVVAPNAGERDSVTLKLPESGGSVRLKVGQRVDAVSGKIEERYGMKSAPEAQESAGVLSGIEEQKATSSGASLARKSARARRAEEALIDAAAATAAAAPPAQSAADRPAQPDPSDSTTPIPSGSMRGY